MKILRNDKGIALVTTLMLTMLSLVIILSLLYMVTRGVQASGSQKRYHTALEASYGGTEIFTKAVIPFILQNYSSPTLISSLTGSSGFANVGLQVNIPASCLQAKILKGTESWPAGCDATASPSKAPDMTLQLQSDSGNPFVVYTKIVNTQQGNTDMGGLALEGASVSEGSNVITPQPKPYLYKMEVQGQRKGDGSVSSDLEVLYAY